MQAGDIVFVRGHGFVSSVIRWAQRRRYPEKYACWTHVAIVLNNDGTVAEALTRHGLVQRNIFRDWNPDTEYEIVSPFSTYDMRCTMVELLRQMLSEREAYDWFDILSVGLSLMTGCRITFGLASHQICSGAAAVVLIACGYPFFNPSRVPPAGVRMALDHSVFSLQPERKPA
jgi:hypothetical protein